MASMIDTLTGVEVPEEYKQLTTRQREVMILVDQGNSLRETAAIMGISVESARTYRRDAFIRLRNPPLEPR